MSDPVTNVEMEDVLSSIRRLVSENPERVRAQNARADGRFVLTPALRVGAQPKGPADSTEGVLVLEIPCDDADISNPVDSVVDDAEVGLFKPEPENSPAPAEPVSTPFPGSWDAVASAEFFANESMHPESKIVELEKAVNLAGEDWEPDGSETDADETPVRHIFATARKAQTKEFTDEKPQAPEGLIKTEAAERVVIAAVTEAAALSDASEGRSGDQVEALFKHGARAALNDAPDISNGSPPDLVVLGAKPDDTDEAENPGEEILPGEQLIDEDMLREIVTNIVREELQGSMGERITRNVRRMVRREIQRANALKDFE